MKIHRLTVLTTLALAFVVARVGLAAGGSEAQNPPAKASTLAADGGAAFLVPEFHLLLDSFPVVEEINSAELAPVHEFPPAASVVTNLLGQPARWLPPGDAPKVMAWVIGRSRGLKPGGTYVLSIEFPDDVPRTVFVGNRGADLVRGFATGSATGDARQQYVQPSLESLGYPQSGQWQRYRCPFILHDRFQGLYAQRDPKPGGRPFTPADGFHVLIFQTKRLNDPRSQGAAVGRLRLHAVPDLATLYAPVELPPAYLPRRRVFLREEMADESVSAREAADRGVPDPLEWYVRKARLLRLLGFNTFGKDLLEFGFNQGWDSGDQNWVMNAQPPLNDLWRKLVPRIADEGLELLPYYEYKGALGLSNAKPPSLGWQRRAQKLYHTPTNTAYTGVWWTERHNADLTDPETLADAKRLLDRTVLACKGQARFAGVWFRTRDNHLPISFADAALARFRAAFPGDTAVASVSRPALIASYEGDRRLYERYVDWWLDRRAAFLHALQQHVAAGLDDPQATLLFTPWTTEQVPLLRDPQSGPNGHPVQITTDDPPWWQALARAQPNSSWFRWALVPTAFDTVVQRNDYGRSLDFREAISPPPWRSEPFHSAPNADPERYRTNAGVMLTFPIGRQFTVARGDLFDRYRSAAGLTAVHHFTLNEDSHDRAKPPGSTPFDGQVGYISMDVDRAGPHATLLYARALANGNPRNLGLLCASAFSSGFPAYLRRFNQAFLALPALPAQPVPGAVADPEIAVRRIPTPKQGEYGFVVNTSMRRKSGVVVKLPASGPVFDLLSRRAVPAGALRLDLDPGELRSYRWGP